jgi:hypothetical protein
MKKMARQPQAAATRLDSVRASRKEDAEFRRGAGQGERRGGHHQHERRELAVFDQVA